MPRNANQVILPGYCQGELTTLEETFGIPVMRGPRDLRQLPEFFGSNMAARADYGDYSIEILAEINHAHV